MLLTVRVSALVAIVSDRKKQTASRTLGFIAFIAYLILTPDAILFAKVGVEFEILCQAGLI